MINFQEVEQKVIDFRNNRNWEQFHSIKDLLLGLNIEVAELQELFLWKDNEEIQKISKAKIEEEIADIGIFIIYISKKFNIDLLLAIERKIEINSSKYPIDKSYNSSKKYNEL